VEAAQPSEEVDKTEGLTPGNNHFGLIRPRRIRRNFSWFIQGRGILAHLAVCADEAGSVSRMSNLELERNLHFEMNMRIFQIKFFAFALISFFSFVASAQTNCQSDGFGGMRCN
jgi:hypothetical protein